MMYTKWLRGTIIAGIFLTLLIPFTIATAQYANIANLLFPVVAFFPFITGKNFVFRILVELMFGLYVLLALHDPQYRPRSSYVLWAIVLFTAWAGFANIFSVDPVKSFWSNFERMEGYITILHLAAYFVVVSAVLNTQKLWVRYLQASVGASVLMALYGLLQVVGWIAIDQGSSRVDGTLGNAIYFAVYMLFNIFFALYLMYRDRARTGLMITYGCIALLDTILLFFSETRGTILGLFGGLLVGAAYFWFATRHDAGLRRLRMAALYAAIVLVVCAGLVFALRHQPFMQHIPGVGRLASISLSDGETTTRLVIWKMAWQGFKEKPVLGWGQENFDYVFNKFYQPQLWSQESWFDRAHNSYIDWAINAGAPGFVLFIVLLGVAAWGVVRTRELSAGERAIFLGLVVGFAVHEFFVFDNVVSWIQFFTLLALAHVLIVRPAAERSWYSRPVSNNGMAVMVPIVSVVTLAGVWFLNVPGIVGATTLLASVQPINPTLGDAGAQQSLAYFKSALADGSLGHQETTEQLLQAAISINSSSSYGTQVKQDYYTTSLAAITAMTKQRQHDARLELFFGNFLNQYNQPSLALQELQMAHEDSPDKQQILFEIGVDTYIRAGDFKDALPVLKDAYDLDHTYDDARIYYAIGLYYNNNIGDADQLLIDRFGTVEIDNAALVSAFYQTKQYARAEDIIKTRLASNKSDLQSWVQLASIYYSSGDKVDTIATLKSAEAANPASAAQIDALIAQVQTAKAQ